MKRLLSLLFFALTPVLMAQSINIGGVQKAGIPLPGNVIGINYAYGAGQLLKSLNYANFGYFPQAYWQSSWDCSQGGAQTTLTWFNSDNGSGGYATNFFNGATYYGISQAGSLLGTGTISAQTPNTGGTGPTFTLSSVLSSACTTGSNTTLRDSLIVQLRTGTSGLMTPANELDHLSGTAVWSNDVSPSSPNQAQSLDLTNGAVTFYIDQLQANTANTAAPSTAVNSININGSYTGTFKAKCVTNGCAVAYSLIRGGGTTFLSSSVSPSTSAWTTYNEPFTGTENGSQVGQLPYIITVTGEARLQDVDVLEGSTLAGNTSMYRDDVVQHLSASAGSVVRLMEPSGWCTDVLDQIQPFGGNRVCSSSHTQFAGDNGFGQPAQNYPEFLKLMVQIQKSPWISLGKFNTSADFTLWMQYLGGACGTTGGAIRCAAGQTATWNSVFAGLGLPIYTEYGNELWNTSASGWIDGGDGSSYGYLVGQAMTAAKAASGYSSTTDKLIAGGWASGSQAYGSGGWANQLFLGAGCSTGTPTPCPDYIGQAPYTLNTLDSLSDPFIDEVAEIVNIDSVSSTSGTSMLKAQNYAATFGVNVAIYEVSYSPTSGTATPTQSQMNGITGSVGMALTTMEHELLMQRDAHVYGPINEFAFTDQINNGACCSVRDTAWQAVDYLAAGPGQIGSWNDVLRPIGILQQLVTSAIGGHKQLMTVTQTAIPTFNYAGGQGGTILANSAVPYVEAFAYSDGAGNYTVLLFNNNDSASETITLSGSVPSGSVTKTVFGGTTNLVTDNNVNFNINNNGSTPNVVAPTPTTTSGTSYTLPQNSVTLLVYSTSSSVPAPPVLTGILKGNAVLQ
jgi:hypothetical protein